MSAPAKAGRNTALARLRTWWMNPWANLASW